MKYTFEYILCNRIKVVAESKRNYSEGYWLVKPQLGKLTVTNLVNFAEAEGAYGVASG